MIRTLIARNWKISINNETSCSRGHWKDRNEEEKNYEESELEIIPTIFFVQKIVQIGYFNSPIDYVAIIAINKSFDSFVITYSCHE